MNIEKLICTEIEFDNKKYKVTGVNFEKDNIILNVEEIKAKLKELQQDDDVEVSHYKADQIICKLLDDLGYNDVVKEYNKISKWYA
jgi:hypothetical protein